MESFFNNASVSAFLGALFGGIFAVATVFVTDRLRDRRTVKTIRSEISIAHDHAKNKLETVRNMRRAMLERKQIIPGEVLRFDVGVIRELKARILHLLKPRQRQALDAVLFRMERVDAHLEDIHEGQQALRGELPTDKRDEAVARLASILHDNIVNLKVLIEIADRYCKGDFAGITQKQYRLGDYAEPLESDS